MHVNRFFLLNEIYTSANIVHVLVYIITHHQCLLLASPISCFTFYEDCFGAEQQMQTLNSNSYKADIISGNVEADGEAIEMQIVLEPWQRGKEIGWDDNASKPLQFVKKAALCHKTGMDFNTSGATVLKRIIFRNGKKEIK